MISLTATLTTPSLDALIKELPERLQSACTETGQTIQKEFEATSVRRTGSLAESVALVTSDGKINDSGARSVRAAHGPFVEFGTTRMAARPRFTPAVESQRAPFEQRVAKALEP